MRSPYRLGHVAGRVVFAGGSFDLFCMKFDKIVPLPPDKLCYLCKKTYGYEQT